MAKPAKDLDLIGTRVGRLKVISRAEDRTTVRPSGHNRTRRYWNCKCDCGNEVEVRQDALLGETSKSCGCLTKEAAYEQIKKAQAVGYKKPIENLSGQVFGRLTVVSQAESSTTPKGRKLTRWNCECKCGNTINVLHDALKAGKAMTCGCVPPEFADSSYMNKAEVFIHKAKEVHGDKYDYSQTEYVHSQEDVIIVCPQHGAFIQQASNHLSGSGCTKCHGFVTGGRGRFVPVEEILTCKEHGPYNVSEGCVGCLEKEASIRISNFIENARAIHGDRYEYSKVFFETNKEKVEISCKLHGKFNQAVCDHVKGQGCPECGRLSKLVGINAFIERSIDVHGDRFDYSLVEYTHSNTPVPIICKSHGVYMQKPSAHMNGQKCPKCAGEERAAKQHWNYIKRCELNEELGNSSGVLYLLKMKADDETFLKVGVSSNFKRRLAHYKEYSIDVEVIKAIESTALKTAYWERDILSLIRSNGFKYLPSKDFKGWTECASVDAIDFILDAFGRLS